MTTALATQLLYDTDQDALFEVDELPHDKPWISVCVYKVTLDKTTDYEVWLYVWDPVSNKETPSYLQSFQSLEEAKAFSCQQLKSRTSLQ